MNRLDCVRIYDDDVETHSCFQTKNRIEFVVDKRKINQLLARVFGNIYNVSTSRYHDGVIVYCPQDYWDFLAFLKEMKVKGQNIEVFRMENGPEHVLSNNKVTFYEPKIVKNGVKFLIECAAESLKDSSLTEEEINERKAKFIAKCQTILDDLGVGLSSEKAI